MNHIDPSSRFTSTSLYVKGLFLMVKQTSQVWTLRKSHERLWTGGGFGLRNGRIVQLLLDGNSWTRLDPSDELFGKWPPKKLIGSFWPLLTELHEQASAEIYQEVYYPQNATQFDTNHISEFLLRRLSGLDSPQTWNPFRGT